MALVNLIFDKGIEQYKNATRKYIHCYIWMLNEDMKIILTFLVFICQVISEDQVNPINSMERDKSLGSRSSSGSSADQSVRSARAVKVFGDLVNDESSLCYSPSPTVAPKKGLRNITNVCQSSPSRVLPFGSIQFTTVKKNSKKNSEGEALKEVKQIDTRQPMNSGQEKLSSIEEDKDLTIFKTEQTNATAAPTDKLKTKKRTIQKSAKSPVRRQVQKSKFRSNTSSIKRKAQATKAKRAIRQATESVNETLNASRHAKAEYHRNVAAEVARLREEWIAEKEEAARFYAEVDKTKREMLDLRSQLSSQYAQNKADTERHHFQERLNELDREIKFKSDVFVQHKQKLKENEDRRRRLSTHMKANIWKERRDATVRIEMDRIEEEHDRIEHKWAGEDDAKAYLKQCEKERRESFAFRNAEASKQRAIMAEKQCQNKEVQHEGFELKWAGENDGKEYLRQCDKARRESFAFRNNEGRKQRVEEEERKALRKAAEHESYELKWAGEKDAEDYLQRCERERRDSLAFRNAEGRQQCKVDAERKADQKVVEHLSYELKWKGEEDAKAYLKRCDQERRESFAFRNKEGKKQREQAEERKMDEKIAEHESYELKWAGQDDAEQYRERCEKARRESLVSRGKEYMRHREVMAELRNIAKEKEHESFVLSWAAQDDVKKYLKKLAQERRASLAFRNREGKRQRDLEEEWKCEELQKRHELELTRSACK